MLHARVSFDRVDGVQEAQTVDLATVALVVNAVQGVVFLQVSRKYLSVLLANFVEGEVKMNQFGVINQCLSPLLADFPLLKTTADAVPAQVDDSQGKVFLEYLCDCSSPLGPNIIPAEIKFTQLR